MRAVVVGAGPVGVFCGLSLARRGVDVVLVDRDAGPPAAGAWARRGVMQFHLPHFFRPMVREVLQSGLPDLWDAIVAAGGIPARPAGLPEKMTGLQCRRSTFERAAWSVVAAEPGVRLLTGHADGLVSDRGRVTGVVIDGQVLDADLVIAATGRVGRFADDIARVSQGGPCGFSYVTRMYRARPGVEPPNAGMPMMSLYDGYQAIVFPQDDSTLSALIVRPSTDELLAQLRRTELYETAAARIPQLAPWTDPERFEPITAVMAGGGLANVYRGQLDGHGRVPVAGVFFVGDAVCTTNPAAGRGAALGLSQAQTLIGMLDETTDLCAVALCFDAWCTHNIKPWFDDHVYWDRTLLARFRGEDLDLDARIPSDVVCAAAQVDPSIFAAAGPYLAMLALPSVLDSVQENARSVLRTGWRPPYADGPTRDQLADGLVRSAA